MDKQDYVRISNNILKIFFLLRVQKKNYPGWTHWGVKFQSWNPWKSKIRYSVRNEINWMRIWDPQTVEWLDCKKTWLHCKQKIENYQLKTLLYK